MNKILKFLGMIMVVLLLITYAEPAVTTTADMHYTNIDFGVQKDLSYAIKKSEHIPKTISTKPKTVTMKTQVLQYDMYDMRIKSHLSEEAVSDMLEGTAIQCLSETFVEMEEKYNVNLVYIIAITALESAWGTSERANNGSNNLTGNAVYGDDSPGTYFESWDACIEETFRLLSEEYLSQDGLYFGGGFSIYNVNSKYSTSKNWASSVMDIVNQFKRQNTQYVTAEQEEIKNSPV